MTTLSPPRKLRLYDRFWNWAIPLSPEEVAVLNEERAGLVQYERILKAEAERLELENRAKAAEVAIAEEQNEALRKHMEQMRLLARAQFGLRSKWGSGDWKNIKVIASLSESQIKRQIAFKAVEAKSRAVIELDITSSITFIEATRVYELFLQPWMQGTVELDELANLEADECFEHIEFVGGRKPG